MVIQSINNPSPNVPLADSATSSSNSGSSTKTSGLGGTAPSEQMFLQLLVAQIKNQDPTSPADPSQFVAQLAQFSQLEQVIAIRQGIDTLNSTAAAAAPTTTDTTAI